MKKSVFLMVGLFASSAFGAENPAVYTGASAEFSSQVGVDKSDLQSSCKIQRNDIDGIITFDITVGSTNRTLVSDKIEIPADSFSLSKSDLYEKMSSTHAKNSLITSNVNFTGLNLSIVRSKSSPEETLASLDEGSTKSEVSIRFVANGQDLEPTEVTFFREIRESRNAEPTLLVKGNCAIELGR